jgi:hypothetical protein
MLAAAPLPGVAGSREVAVASTLIGKQAVVIGAGMGGLAAAGTRLCRMVFGAGDLGADLGFRQSSLIRYRANFPNLRPNSQVDSRLE